LTVFWISRDEVAMLAVSFDGGAVSSDTSRSRLFDQNPGEYRRLKNQGAYVDGLARRARRQIA
jgi:hypothetical protein